MTPTRRHALILSLAAVLIASAATPLALAQDAPAANQFDGFTRPSLDVDVASRAEGIVAEVVVREGQAVRKGDLLVRLDSTAEKIDVELSRLLAESDRQLEAAQLIEKQKAAELTRAQSLVASGAVTGSELEQKALDHKVAQLNVEVAKAKQQAARLQYQRDVERLAQREIHAPADGIVTRVLKDPGESVQRLEKVVQLVQLDPLEVVLNLPVETRGRYADGGKATLRIAGDSADRSAEIVAVDPVVDFASNTYRLKLRLPNPDGKLQAGLRVRVTLAPAN